MRGGTGWCAAVVASVLDACAEVVVVGTEAADEVSLGSGAEATGSGADVLVTVCVEAVSGASATMASEAMAGDSCTQATERMGAVAASLRVGVEVGVGLGVGVGVGLKVGLGVMVGGGLG